MAKYLDPPPPTVGTREISHTSEWIRSKVIKVMDSLLLKGKAGCLPSWHGIQSKGLEETELNRSLDTKVFMWGKEIWLRRECHNSMKEEATITSAETMKKECEVKWARSAVQPYVQSQLFASSENTT